MAGAVLVCAAHGAAARPVRAAQAEAGDGVSKGAVAPFGPAEGWGVSKGGRLWHPPFAYGIAMLSLVG